jgi:hypothetical protein
VTVYLDAIPSHLELSRARGSGHRRLPALGHVFEQILNQLFTQCCNNSRALNVALASCFKVGEVNHSIDVITRSARTNFSSSPAASTGAEN